MNDELRDLFGELIAEVEKWKKIAHKQARRAAGYRLAAKRHRREVERLRDLIDKPPEDADWVADYHLLQSALDGPIIDAARKWHAAYRKAQNSNLMRAKEVERLRSENDRLRTPSAADDWGNPIVLSVSGGIYEEEGITAKDAEITAWIADRDNWIARYEAVRKEMGARIKELSDLNESLMENGNDLRTRCQKAEARIKELQDLIDKPPEEADWVADYHLLQSALDGPIIDAARKWHAAYRKAQNSNLMRAKEVERLRSAFAHELDLRDRHIKSLEARIADQEAYIERLEAAFLEQFVQGIQAPREKVELMAREALERIRRGEKR